MPDDRLPWALMELHHALAVGGAGAPHADAGDGEGPFADDDFAGRFFARWAADALADVLAGAGFDASTSRAATATTPSGCMLGSARARTLPDFVGPGMRLLVCGLNPSVYAADAGVGFATARQPVLARRARRGHRHARPRPPARASSDHGVGMTDLVKRATAARRGAHRVDEYRDGAGARRAHRALAPPRRGLLRRARRLARRGRPQRGSRVCSPTTFGGVPAYVMPSTSGLNARVPLDDLADHLRRAALADRERR